MSTSTSKTPKQAFETGIKKALQYGTVFVNDFEIHTDRDGVGLVRSGEPCSCSKLFARFHLALDPAEQKEGPLITEIAASLRSLQSNPEGKSPSFLKFPLFANTVHVCVFAHQIPCNGC